MRKIERSERIDLSSGLELQLRVSEVDGKRKRDRAMAVQNCKYANGRLLVPWFKLIEYCTR